MKTKTDKRLVVETIIFTTLWIAAAATLYFIFKN